MSSKKILPFFAIVMLPVIFAWALPFFFRFNIFKEPDQLVAVIAIIGLPFAGGLLVTACSSIAKVNSFSYRIFTPWLAVLFFFFSTFLFGLKECACWLIGLPLYLILSSLGGLTGGYFRLNNAARQSIKQTSGH